MTGCVYETDSHREGRTHPKSISVYLSNYHLHRYCCYINDSRCVSAVGLTQTVTRSLTLSQHDKLTSFILHLKENISRVVWVCFLFLFFFSVYVKYTSVCFYVLVLQGQIIWQHLGSDPGLTGSDGEDHTPCCSNDTV